jgi:hypothetical protein
LGVLQNSVPRPVSVDQKPTRIARAASNPGPRDKKIDTHHASMATGRCLDVNMILVINIPQRPLTFSIASGSAPVPVGCQQRLHQSEDDRLPDTVGQTIKIRPG